MSRYARRSRVGRLERPSRSYPGASGGGGGAAAADPPTAAGSAWDLASISMDVGALFSLETGDYVMAHTVRASTSSSCVPSTSGYTQTELGTVGGIGNYKQRSFKIEVGGTTTGIWSMSNATLGSFMGLLHVQGTNGTVDDLVEYNAQSTATSQDVTGPTSTVANCLDVIMTSGNNDNNGGGNPWTGPHSNNPSDGWTLHFARGTSSGSDACIGLWSRTQADIGTAPTATFTQAAAYSHLTAVRILLQPAS